MFDGRGLVDEAFKDGSGSEHPLGRCNQLD